MSWKQPSVTGDETFTNSEYEIAPNAAFWSGTGATDLIQAGVTAFATATPQYKFWIENYPEKPKYEGPVVYPGDELYVYEQFNYEGPEGDDYTQFYLENGTTHEYLPFVESTPYIGDSAANFIMERGTGNKNPENNYLPTFADTPVWGNQFGTKTNSYALRAGYNDADIISSTCEVGGEVLATSTEVSEESSFEMLWYGKGPPSCEYE